MPRISFAFFTLSALCGLAGMSWGLWMGASEQMGTAVAHAHLNLLGWLGLAVMGAFHALAAGRVPTLLAWANFAMSAAGALLLPAGIAGFVLGYNGAVVLAMAGGMLALAGLTSFIACVIVSWISTERAGAA